MIAVNLVGIWPRQGEKVKIFSLDNVVNGDQNYVELEVDVFEKKAYVKVYALNWWRLEIVYLIQSSNRHILKVELLEVVKLEIVDLVKPLNWDILKL